MAKNKKKKLTIPFSEAANPAWLTRNLSKYLWQEPHPAEKITHIEIKHIWESSRRVTVLYQVDFNGVPGRNFSHQYVGYIVNAEKLESEFNKSEQSAKVVPPTGRAVMMIPEANMVLTAFPNDRKMRLLSEEDVSKWLPGNFKKITKKIEKPVEVIDTTIEPLRYVPDKRYTTRCQAMLKNGQTEDAKSVSFVAKQLSDHSKARKLFNSLHALAKIFHGPQNGDEATRYSYPVRIPEPLALFEKKPVVFIEELPGKNLKYQLPQLDLPKYMYRVGALLANFHKAKKRVRKQITHRNEILEVREAAFLVRRTFPAMSKNVRTFFKAFQQVEWQDGAPAVLLHGSYRLNHIFVRGEELFLLDLDSVRMGHPAYDIGNFLSSLYYLDAQDRFTESEREQISQHFLRGYSEHSPQQISAQAVLWFLASLLMNKQAFKYVTHAHDDREEKVQLMFALAQQALTACSGVHLEAGLGEVMHYLPVASGCTAAEG